MIPWYICSFSIRITRPGDLFLKDSFPIQHMRPGAAEGGGSLGRSEQRFVFEGGAEHQRGREGWPGWWGVEERREIKSVA